MMFSFFCCSQKQEFFSYSPAEFEKLIKEDSTVQLIDVRRTEEYDSGHIYNAILIDVLDSGFIVKAGLILDRSKPVAVYCRSGKRSKNAAGKLAKKGYKVYELDSGYLGWVTYRKNEE